MRLRKSLIFRLTALYTLIFAASVGALFAVVWVVTSRTMLNQIAAEVQRETISLADEYRATDAATAAASIERRLRRGGLSYYLLQDGNGAWLAGNIAPVDPIVDFVELQVQLQSQGENGANQLTDNRRQALG